MTEKEELDRISKIAKEYFVPAIKAEILDYAKKVSEVVSRLENKIKNYDLEVSHMESRVSALDGDVQELKKGIGKALLDLAKKED